MEGSWGGGGWKVRMRRKGSGGSVVDLMTRQVYTGLTDPLSTTTTPTPSKELYTLGGRCAALLRSGNVRRGDVVVVILPNSPERVVVEAALLLLSAFSVTGPCKVLLRRTPSKHTVIVSTQSSTSSLVSWFSCS